MEDLESAMTAAGGRGGVVWCRVDGGLVAADDCDICPGQPFLHARQTSEVLAGRAGSLPESRFACCGSTGTVLCILNATRDRRPIQSDKNRRQQQQDTQTFSASLESPPPVSLFVSQHPRSLTGTRAHSTRLPFSPPPLAVFAVGIEL